MTNPINSIRSPDWSYSYSTLERTLSQSHGLDLNTNRNIRNFQIIGSNGQTITCNSVREFKARIEQHFGRAGLQPGITIRISFRRPVHGIDSMSFRLSEKRNTNWFGTTEDVVAERIDSCYYVARRMLDTVTTSRDGTLSRAQITSIFGQSDASNTREINITNVEEFERNLMSMAILRGLPITGIRYNRRTGKITISLSQPQEIKIKYRGFLICTINTGREIEIGISRQLKRGRVLLPMDGFIINSLTGINITVNGFARLAGSNSDIQAMLPPSANIFIGTIRSGDPLRVIIAKNSQSASRYTYYLEMYNRSQYSLGSDVVREIFNR
jgi:hypothetical protein